MRGESLAPPLARQVPRIYRLGEEEPAGGLPLPSHLQYALRLPLRLPLSLADLPQNGAFVLHSIRARIARDFSRGPSLARGGALTLLFLLLFLGRGFGQEPVVILHWNDLHGQVYPVKRSSGELQGGFRALAAIVAEERESQGTDRVLLLDAGDWFQGTPEGNLSKGTMITELFNAVGVDAAAIGNHEFDYGVENLRRLVQLSNFPVLGGNVLKSDRSGRADYALPHTIIERGGIRFGLIGCVTEDTKQTVLAEVAKDLQFSDATESVRESVAALRADGAEMIIVLSHLGAEPDVELAREVAGIDLILGGHTHTLVQPRLEPTHNTLICQAEANSKYIGRLEVRRQGTGFEITGEMLPVAARTEPVATEIEEILTTYRDSIEATMSQPVGTAPFSMERSPRPAKEPDDPKAERSTFGWHPSADPLATWLAQVMADVAGTNIAIHNRGGVRAPLPSGPISRRELFGISPFGNTIARAQLTGAQLRQMVETGLSDASKRFDVVGLEIGWTHGDEWSESKKLVKLTHEGIAIEDDKLYSIATNNYLAGGGDGWTQFAERGFENTNVELYEASVMAFASPDLVESMEEARDAETYFQVASPVERATSLFGLLALLIIGWLLSTNRKVIPWRIIGWGLALQVILAALVLRTGPGRWFFDGAKEAFQLILGFSASGADFVWGPLANIGSSGFIFAIQISATIILVSSLTAMLYHIGFMQLIVYALAKTMQWTMRTSGAESLAAAANIFVGQTEAPLVVRPYLAKMTSSEMMCLMTGGMATVAGGVLAAYVGMGVDAGHLLAASVMSAPAALVLAKIMVPETEKSETAADVPFSIERVDSNVLDAACRGASDGLKLSLNVMAMLIAFTALVAMADWGIGAVESWFLSKETLESPDFKPLTLGMVLGKIFAPLAFLLGVHPEETEKVGFLLGIKMTLNEFFGYTELTKLSGELSPRSQMLATYALCGFANFASIAIQIGGISALEKGCRPTLAKFGLRAMIGGTIAALMTACIAGVLA